MHSKAYTIIFLPIFLHTLKNWLRSYTKFLRRSIKHNKEDYKILSLCITLYVHSNVEVLMYAIP